MRKLSATKAARFIALALGAALAWWALADRDPVPSTTRSEMAIQDVEGPSAVVDRPRLSSLDAGVGTTPIAAGTDWVPVSVSDADGAPVADALVEVLVVSGGAATRLGILPPNAPRLGARTTDALGSANVPKIAPPGASLAVRTSKAGYATLVVHEGPSAGRTYTLQAGAAIRGIVQTASGKRRGGVRVSCRRAQEPDHVHRSRRAEDSSLLETLTDEDGSFEFLDLTPRFQYQLSIRTPGLLVTDESERRWGPTVNAPLAVAPSSNVVIEIRSVRLFGLRLIDARTGDAVATALPLITVLPHGGFQGLGGQGALWLPAPDGWIRSRRYDPVRGEYIGAVALSEEAKLAGKVRVLVQVEGYENAAAQVLTSTPSLSGESPAVRTAEVRLKPKEEIEARGSVRLILPLGLAAAYHADERRILICRWEGHGRPRAYLGVPEGASEWTFRGLPTGRHSISQIQGGPVLRQGNWQVDVPPNGVATLRFPPIAKPSGVVFEVTAADGIQLAEVDAIIAVDLDAPHAKSGPVGGAGRLVLRHPAEDGVLRPTLFPIHPGRYEFLVQQRGFGSSRSAVVTVNADELVRVHVLIEREN